MEQELRECAHCGQRRPDIREGHRNGAIGVYLWCSSCGIQSPLFCYDKIITSGKQLAIEKAITSWNRRASDAALTESRHACNGLEQAIADFTAETDKTDWCQRLKYGQCSIRKCLVDDDGAICSPGSYDGATCARFRLELARQALSRPSDAT